MTDHFQSSVVRMFHHREQAWEPETSHTLGQNAVRVHNNLDMFSSILMLSVVWPEMRNCQNFENEGFSLKWAGEMTWTKKNKKLYTPRKTK